MSTAVQSLGTYKGLWLAGRTTPVDPDAPPFGSGCAIGSTGRRFVIELFYNPGAQLRMGAETFGAEAFGEYIGAAPTEDQWIDVTANSIGGVVTRGNVRPNLASPTDEFIFDLYDPGAQIVDWRPPTSLGSPNLNTPVRVGVMARDGTYVPSYTGRILRMFDVHDAPQRYVTIQTFGNKVDLVTSLLDPDFPKQTAQARIDSILTDIGWSNGYDPGYPADNPNLSWSLEADQQLRVGATALAAFCIQQAAISCGYRVSINRAGQFRLLPVPAPSIPVTGLIVADCPDDGVTDVDAIYSNAVFASDAAEVTNVVQLINTPFPAKSAEAIDAASVARWGRRTQGYGFPAYIANDSTGETQANADAMLAAVSNIVNRCELITFNTLTDPDWWNTLGLIEIGSSLIVRRYQPTYIEFTCNIIGITYAISENGYIEGTLHLMSLDQTL